MTRLKVGEIRPTQLMFTYGVGSIIDLPKLSVIVLGLEDWPNKPELMTPIIESRLLQAVRYHHQDVKQLLSAPVSTDEKESPFDEGGFNGAPVAIFPRWMVCPECHLLAPLSTGLFKLDENFYQLDKNVYRHEGCPKIKSNKGPEVVPARIMAACEQGHLDDFPWNEFVHFGQACSGKPFLRLMEVGPSGEARDLQVVCDTCKSKRRLSQAFGVNNRKKLPDCSKRRPHLKDYDSNDCGKKIRPIVLGASNTWFPMVLNSIAIPVDVGRLPQLVEDHWAILTAVKNTDILDAFRSIGQISGELSEYNNEDIFAEIQNKRKEENDGFQKTNEEPDLKYPEWIVLSKPNPKLNSKDFRLRSVDVPQFYSTLIKQVVLVERLREVSALIGFTRIDSFEEFTDPDMNAEPPIVPLSRQEPTWVPANEVRGEGIFIQFDEKALSKWMHKPEVIQLELEFFDSHKQWRETRFIENVEEGFPGSRYILIHSFAHALMRQFSLECGYSSASIRERIYAKPASDTAEAMAGVLIYTSAPDSEGTLGGLVSLGETKTLERHIQQALETAHLCASDPLCAENIPSKSGQTVHASACHACLFSPETSCERGNKYLDRSVLIHTVERDDLSFFE